jgi:hypothetical protein
VRIARTGSTRAARRAGIALAGARDQLSATATVMNVTGIARAHVAEKCRQ